MANFPQNPYEYVQRLLEGGLQSIVGGTANRVEGMQRSAELAEAHERQEGLDAARRAEAMGADALRRAQDSLSQLIALRAPEAEIIQAQNLVANLTSAMQAPTMGLSDAVSGALSANVAPSAPFVPGMDMSQPGAFGPPPAPGTQPEPQTQFPLAPPRTGAQQVAAGAGVAQSLQRIQGFTDMGLETAIRNVQNVNPGDPGSVVRLATSLAYLETLPESDQNLAAPMVGQAMATIESDPDARELFDNAMRSQRLALETSEFNLEAGRAAEDRAEERFDWERDENEWSVEQREWARLQFEAWRKREPVEFQRLLSVVGEESAQRVVTATQTGVYEHLSDSEKAQLARTMGVEADALPDAMRAVAERNERARELEVRSMELQNEQTEQSIMLGGVEYELKGVALKRNRWAFDREKFTAQAQDEEMIATGIASAIRNGDTTVMAFYATAFDDPNSALGGLLRANNVTEDQLAGYMLQAQRQYDADQARLEVDDRFREAQADMAVLNLQNAQELSPLEREALRAEYELRAQRAQADLRDIVFTQTANRLVAISNMADVVPPGFWDDVPPAVMGVVEELGLSTDELRGRSEYNEWLRQAPMRQQGSDMLKFLAQAPPEDEQAASMMISGALSALDLMGVDDPLARAAYLSSLSSVWAVQDFDMRMRLAGLNKQGLSPMDVEAAGKFINAFNTAHLSARRETESFILQDLFGSGCAEGLNVSVIEGTFSPQVTRWHPERNAREGSPWEGQSCGIVINQYMQLRETENAYRTAMDGWGSYLGVPIPGAPGGATPPPGSGTPGSDAPTGPQTVGDTTITAQHVAVFTEMADLHRAGNREGFDALYREMEAAYGTEVTDAYLNRVFGGN